MRNVSDANQCASDTCGHVQTTKPKPIRAASRVTAACFQGRAASGGVRLHRPADHGAAGAAGIAGSSGRAASAPQRVSRNAQAQAATPTGRNPVRKTAGNPQREMQLKPVGSPRFFFLKKTITQIRRDLNKAVVQVNRRWKISDGIPAETHLRQITHLTKPC